MTSNEWAHDVGSIVTRQELAAAYGGSTQSGIQPCRDSPNILIYSDPQSGEKYGYSFDGWNPTKTVFFYSGEGRVGDQKLTKGNKAIVEHVLAGRALRVMISHSFVPGTKTRRHEYIGEFRVDPADAFHIEHGPDERGNEREVFVFHLLPVGITRKHESHSRRSPTPRQATPKRGGAPKPKAPTPRSTPIHSQERPVAASESNIGRTGSSMPQKAQSHLPDKPSPKSPRTSKAQPGPNLPGRPNNQPSGNGKWIAVLVFGVVLALIIGIAIGSS